MFAGVLAVTFDCWGTLIVDRTSVDGHGSLELRVNALSHLGGIDADRARELLTVAWTHHHDAWVKLRNYGAAGIAAFCLEELGLSEDTERLGALVEAFEEASVSFGVDVVEGSLPTLEELRRRGVRTALVCDTGFTPGRVVRRILSDTGIAPHLETFAFSDEVGVPKPHERMFRTALDGIGIGAAETVHIGDLRRTDVAGARAMGMRTVRFKGVTDDVTDHPEADAVISRMSDLPPLLDGGRSGP